MPVIRWLMSDAKSRVFCWTLASASAVSSSSFRSRIVGAFSLGLFNGMLKLARFPGFPGAVECCAVRGVHLPWRQKMTLRRQAELLQYRA